MRARKSCLKSIVEEMRYQIRVASAVDTVDVAQKKQTVTDEWLREASDSISGTL
ncbi:MAG: hypothetical protein ACLU80_17265 [Dorea sp.]